MASRREFRRKKTPRPKRPHASAPTLYLYSREAEPVDWEIEGKWEDEFHKQVGYTKEELAALDFLQGWEREGILEYPTGMDEVQGRIALINLLARKKPLSRFLRQALINLFSQADVAPRELIAMPRSKRSVSASKDRSIASYAHQRASQTDWKNVIKDTANAFRLSERAIWDALARDKQRHPNLHKYRRRVKQ